MNEIGGKCSSSNNTNNNNNGRGNNHHNCNSQSLLVIDSCTFVNDTCSLFTAESNLPGKTYLVVAANTVVLFKHCTFYNIIDCSNSDIITTTNHTTN